VGWEWEWGSEWEREREREWDWDNIIAALEHSERVRRIKLTDIPDTGWDTLAAAMQVRFPELTDLQLWSFARRSVPVLPDSFLGGTAPDLRLLDLRNVVYPAARELHLFSKDLVHLSLWQLPHTGYISPDSMVACLSSLNRLESLRLGFESRQPRPDQPRPSPQTRVLLPTLAMFTFEGLGDYLEDFVARIDTPMLSQLITSLTMDIVFDIPYLKQFIGRIKGLKLSKTAVMSFYPTFTSLKLDHFQLTLSIEGDRIDWLISSMVLVCGRLSPFFSLIERLDLTAMRHLRLHKLKGHNRINYTRVVELLQSFTAVQRLSISKTLEPLIAPALHEHIEETAIEVLPNLHDLFLGGYVPPGPLPIAIRQFVIARQLYGRRIAVHYWGEG
jgi:hypothetical protein